MVENKKETKQIEESGANKSQQARESPKREPMERERAEKLFWQLFEFLELTFILNFRVARRAGVLGAHVGEQAFYVSFLGQVRTSSPKHMQQEEVHSWQNQINKLGISLGEERVILCLFESFNIYFIQGNINVKSVEINSYVRGQLYGRKDIIVEWF